MRPQPSRPNSPWDRPAPGTGAMGQRAGGSFLGGAAQTAMGVAGGVLLGNAIAGMLAPDAAEAPEGGFDEGGDDASALDDAGGFDDFDL